MTELIEVISTTRILAPDDGPVHVHYQHFTPDGDLIVEWCEFEDDCDGIKSPDQ